LPKGKSTELGRSVDTLELITIYFNFFKFSKDYKLIKLFVTS